MPTIPVTVRSYIAGFLDGDGCIMFQLVKHRDYRFGFEIRGSVIFYQKSSNKHYLEWLKDLLGCGYLRDRNDGVTEYCIVGIAAVRNLLDLLGQYIVLKKGQVRLAEQICLLLREKSDVRKFVQAAELVDGFGELNYSKRRKNTSSMLKDFLMTRGLYPRND